MLITSSLLSCICSSYRVEHRVTVYLSETRYWYKCILFFKLEESNYFHFSLWLTLGPVYSLAASASLWTYWIRVCILTRALRRLVCTLKFQKNCSKLVDCDFGCTLESLEDFNVQPILRTKTKDKNMPPLLPLDWALLTSLKNRTLMHKRNTLVMRSCCVALGTISSHLWRSMIMWENRMYLCMCNWVTMLYSRKKNVFGK